MSLVFAVILILIGAMVPISSHADCATGSPPCDKPQLRLIIGSQFTSCPPEISYDKKGKSSPRKVDVQKDFAEEGYSPFPFMNLEYRTSQESFWSLTYDQDESQTAALTEETIKFLFFPITFRVNIPGEIETQSLKFFYNRAFFQNEGFEFGGSLGMQVLNVKAKADRPIWGAEEYDYLAPLPAFGFFSSYRQSDRLTYRLKADYFSLESFSIGSVSIGGVSTELDCSLEYQYNRNWIIGAGYRVSYLKVEVDDEDYSLNGSHVAHGPKFFVGVSF